MFTFFYLTAVGALLELSLNVIMPAIKQFCFDLYVREEVQGKKLKLYSSDVLSVLT